MAEDRATEPGATTTTEVGGVAGERSTVARLTEDVPARAGAAATAETAIAAPAAGERLGERRSRAAATTEAALTAVPVSQPPPPPPPP